MASKVLDVARHVSADMTSFRGILICPTFTNADPATLKAIMDVLRIGDVTVNWPATIPPDCDAAIFELTINGERLLTIRLGTTK